MKVAFFLPLLQTESYVYLSHILDVVFSLILFKRTTVMEAKQIEARIGD